MCTRARATQLIIGAVIQAPHDCSTALHGIVVVINRCGLRTEVCHRNQPKLLLCKPLLYGYGTVVRNPYY